MQIALRQLQDRDYGGLGIYLGERHFTLMVGIAAAVHLLALTIYALLPHSEALDIPVRVLNVKLAGPSPASVRGAASAKPGEAKIGEAKGGAAPVSASVAARAKAPPPRKGGKGAALPPVAAASVPAPAAAPDDAASRAASRKKTKGEQAVDAVSAAFKARTLPGENPGGMPKRFVRAGEGAGGEGSIYGNSELSKTEVVRRYEQILSLWIEQHKVYPAEARRAKLQGDAVVRIRIDRAGNILRFRLERPTGHAIIDNAVGQMIAAANPVPAVPENYPSGNQIEFLVPVSFRVVE